MGPTSKRFDSETSADWIEDRPGMGPRVLWISYTLFALSVIGVAFGPTLFVDFPWWLNLIMVVLALSVLAVLDGQRKNSLQKAKDEMSELLSREREKKQRLLEAREAELWRLYPLSGSVIIRHHGTLKIFVERQAWVVEANFEVINISPWDVVVDVTELVLVANGKYLERTSTLPRARLELKPGHSEVLPMKGRLNDATRALSKERQMLKVPLVSVWLSGYATVTHGDEEGTAVLLTSSPVRKEGLQGHTALQPDQVSA